MSVRRSLIPLALLASATAAALGCEDRSPVGVSLSMPVMQKGGNRTSTTPSGLVVCSQSYDSATQVIGPAGGLIVVGPHFLWVDTMALTAPVSITAVAPSDTMRWVRLQPDGLVFRTNGAGLAAILFTSYKDCGGVPTDGTLRIAQISDALSILGYLQPSPKSSRHYVAGLLDHFSNYAIAW